MTRRLALERLAQLAAGYAVTAPTTSVAFEGGVGGLGKTKPSTGVSVNPEAPAMNFAPGAGNMPGKTLPEVGVSRDPLASGGDAAAFDFERTQTGAVAPVTAPKKGKGGFLAEKLTTSSGNVVDVSFKSPFPSIPTSGGVETRDMNSGDSAFVVALSWQGEDLAKAPQAIFTESILGLQGKYGAYGAPSDIKIIEDSSVKAGRRRIDVSFLALTPAMREVPRRILVEAIQLPETSDVVCLVSGSTAARYRKAEPTFRGIAESFEAQAFNKVAERSARDALLK